MLFFGLSLAAGIAVVYAVQKMDIECVNQKAPTRGFAKGKAETRRPVPASFVPNAVYLRQQ